MYVGGLIPISSPKSPSLLMLARGCSVVDTLFGCWVVRGGGWEGGEGGIASCYNNVRKKLLTLLMICCLWCS